MPWWSDLWSDKVEDEGPPPTDPKCIVCGEPIHPARIAAQPAAKTCTRACSLQRKKELWSASSTRCHRRQRAAKKEQDK